MKPFYKKNKLTKCEYLGKVGILYRYGFFCVCLADLCITELEKTQLENVPCKLQKGFVILTIEDHKVECSETLFGSRTWHCRVLGNLLCTSQLALATSFDVAFLHCVLLQLHKTTSLTTISATLAEKSNRVQFFLLQTFSFCYVEQSNSCEKLSLKMLQSTFNTQRV